MNLIYKVNLTVGTPPQPFSMAIDTAANFAMVPSVDIDQRYHDQIPERLYNSSQSFSYRAHGDLVSREWASYWYYGRVSEDTLGFGLTPFHEFKFEEWIRRNCQNILCWNAGFDGVLGLAPPWQCRREIDNFLEVAKRVMLFPSNQFGLHLPSTHQPTGSLTLGSYNQTLASNLTWFDVVNPRQLYYANNWMVPISHLTLNTPTKPLHVSLNESAIAWLNSPWPYLILPTQLADNMSAIVGVQPGPIPFRIVPCVSRPPATQLDLHPSSSYPDANQETVKPSLPTRTDLQSRPQGKHPQLHPNGLGLHARGRLGERRTRVSLHRVS